MVMPKGWSSKKKFEEGHDGPNPSVKLPDFRTMLPSQARRELQAFLLKQLESSKLNCYADPMLTYADILGMFRNVGSEWVKNQLLLECWEAASKDYHRLHPKGWDNAKQQAYRYVAKI